MIKIEIEGRAATGGRFPNPVDAWRKDVRALRREFPPRLMRAVAKRLGSMLRGRTPVAVHKGKTGRLRRGVKTERYDVAGWPRGGRGRFGVITVESTGPHANRGTIGFVRSAVGRATARKGQRVFGRIARRAMAATIRDLGLGPGASRARGR